MKEVEIRWDWILFWVIISLLIIILTWRTFGSSPPIEAVAFGLTLLGAWLGLEGYRNSKALNVKLNKLGEQHEEQLKFHAEQLKFHAEQVQLLRGIKEILEKKL